MKASIGLFGGTFDPVHKGHVRIAESFKQSGLIEELWILLTPAPPHKTQKVHAPFNLRKKMLEAAFQDHVAIKISTVENTLPRPTYTIQTIEYLTRNYPACTFHLCIGEDSLVHFETWYRYKDILEHCDLIVASRPGFDREEVDEVVKKQAHFVDHEPVDMSASQIRTLLENKQTVDNYLPARVYQIIEENSLYRPEE